MKARRWRRRRRCAALRFACVPHCGRAWRRCCGARRWRDWRSKGAEEVRHQEDRNQYLKHFSKFFDRLAKFFLIFFCLLLAFYIWAACAVLLTLEMKGQELGLAAGAAPLAFPAADRTTAAVFLSSREAVEASIGRERAAREVAALMGVQRGELEETEADFNGGAPLDVFNPLPLAAIAPRLLVSRGFFVCVFYINCLDALPRL
jgi:hypothetical protein